MRRAHGKSGVLGGFCIALVLILLVGGFGYVTQGFKNWDAKTWFRPGGNNEETQEPTPDVSGENGEAMTGGTVYQLPERMTFTTVSAMSATANAGVTVQATVLPENAENKAVDWSIAWADPSSAYATGKTVTDYVTITPQADGSTVAVVKCLKVFDETIIITVTTRDGGFSASCAVVFYGNPESMSILLDGVSGSNDIYNLGTSRTYNFPINLQNQWGQVNADFNNFSATVSNAGAIVVADYTSTMYQTSWGTERTIHLNDIVNRFIEVSISANKLVVKTRGVIDAYYRQQDPAGSAGAIFRDKFKRWSSSAEPFVVTVTESKSGKTARVKFNISASVTGVSVTPGVTF